MLAKVPNQIVNDKVPAEWHVLLRTHSEATGLVNVAQGNASND